MLQNENKIQRICPLFDFTLSPYFHANPTFTALPVLEKSSEYRKQLGINKDHETSSMVDT